MIHLINKIIENPIPCGIGIGIILLFVILGLAIFIKIVGNPIAIILGMIKAIVDTAIKEIAGRSGVVGRLNILIVLIVSLMAIIPLLKLNSPSIFSNQGISNGVVSLLILLSAFITFLVSLKVVNDSEKMEKIYRIDEDKD